MFEGFTCWLVAPDEARGQPYRLAAFVGSRMKDLLDLLGSARRRDGHRQFGIGARTPLDPGGKGEDLTSFGDDGEVMRPRVVSGLLKAAEIGDSRLFEEAADGAGRRLDDRFVHAARLLRLHRRRPLHSRVTERNTPMQASC